MRLFNPLYEIRKFQDENRILKDEILKLKERVSELEDDNTILVERSDNCERLQRKLEGLWTDVNLVSKKHKPNINVNIL